VLDRKPKKGNAHEIKRGKRKSKVSGKGGGEKSWTGKKRGKKRVGDKNRENSLGGNRGGEGKKTLFVKNLREQQPSRKFSQKKKKKKKNRAAATEKGKMERIENVRSGGKKNEGKRGVYQRSKKGVPIT